MQYYVTARAHDNSKMYATYDPVYDSLMIVGKNKDTIKFNTRKDAENAMIGYSCFQRYLKNFKVEKVK